MAESKRLFFNKGCDIQKRADIVFYVRRCECKNIYNWTPEAKEDLKKWVDDCEQVFVAFKNQILSAIK